MAQTQTPNPTTPSPQTSTLPPAENTIEPYLHQALHHPDLEGAVSIYNHSRAPTSQPVLHRNKTNTLLLYPGSFNPPHQGHLATINCLYQHRYALSINSLFLFCDPDSIILTKKKKHGSVILPLSLRNEIFYSTPELRSLVEEGWLHILVGTMDSHIQFLRHLTDIILADEFGAKLVGFLGGDKLSISAPPHEKPGELGIWGPVDEFLIINSRRPVDFYTPSTPDDPSVPANLPGCTGWERGVGDMNVETEREVGVEWVCKALSVKGEPVIRFRGSGESKSNGISSTAIRKIMCEAPDETLHEELAPHVLGVDMLVKWLKRHRLEKGEGGEIEGERAEGGD